MFIGHLEDPVLLAAAGVGNMVLNIFGMAIFYGLNSALETLVSQAYGAKNLELCGLYLQRGRYILSLSYVPIVGIFLLSHLLLTKLGQNALVVDNAYKYILVMIPATYLQGLQDLQRKFLTQVGRAHIQMNT